MQTSVLLKPVSYKEGEPLVTYVTNTATFAIPQRAVVRIQDSFFARQLARNFADVDATTCPGNTTVKLEDPIFQDPTTFSLVLDFLSRTLDSRCDTLRQANNMESLTAEQWENLMELERFIFHKIDRNPIWTGLTGKDFRVNGAVSQKNNTRSIFHIQITPAGLRVDESSCNFWLNVNLTSITNPPIRPVSLLKGKMFGMDMEFPFPVDFKTSYFIPHDKIECMIDNVVTVCEGMLGSDGSIRIEPIDAMAFMWFYFELTPRFIHWQPDRE